MGRRSVTALDIPASLTREPDALIAVLQWTSPHAVPDQQSSLTTSAAWEQERVHSDHTVVAGSAAGDCHESANAQAERVDGGR